MARVDADLVRKGARVLNAGDERALDLRGNRIAEIEHLDATEERTAAAKKFHSKEAEEEAKKVADKAYSPVKVAQDTTKEQGPKALSSGHMPTESEFRKPDSTLADASEETDKTEADKTDNQADENKGEITPVQQVKGSTCKRWMTGTKRQEILGTGVDSLSIDPPGLIDEYIYKSFQQTSLRRFINSWRKRPFYNIHIIPPARLQLPGDCALHATLALMECHFKVFYASLPDGPREFTVRLSHLHLGHMVRDFYESEEGKKFKGRDKLTVCLLMAKIYGVVSEEDFAAGCQPEAVRYRIEEYHELSDIEMEMIPSFLEEAEMILTSFRVTEQYRRTLPHDIYRYQAPEKPVDVHDAHCVVLTSPGVEFKDPEMATDEAEGEVPSERYYEYINSYDGWGVDGCGYIYHSSLRRSYRIRVVDPKI